MVEGKRRRPKARTGPRNRPEGDQIDRTKWLHEQMVEGFEQIANPEGWKALLTMKSRMHHYSFRNTLAILVQQPDATMVAGYTDWVKKHKRRPLKREDGGNPLYIWAPHDRWAMEVDKTTGEEKRVKVPGFHATHCYDISSTVPLDPNAPELPANRDVHLTGDAPAALWDGLVGLLADRGYTVERTPIGGGVKGDTGKDGRVRIDPGGTPMEQLMVLAHETSHVLCGHIEAIDGYQRHRGTYEVEAESVAWIAMTAAGLDLGDWSFNYQDGWARGDVKKLIEVADKVCKTADKLIDELLPELDNGLEGESLEVGGVTGLT